MSDLKASVKLSLEDKLTAPLRRTRSAIEDVQKQANKVESFKKLLAVTHENRKAIQLHQAETNRLAQAIKNAEKPSKTLKKQLDASVRATRAAKQANVDHTQSLSRLRGELRGASIDTRKLTDEQRRLGISSNSLSRIEARQAHTAAKRESWQQRRLLAAQQHQAIVEQRRAKYGKRSFRTENSTIDTPRPTMGQRLGQNVDLGNMSGKILGAGRTLGIAGAMGSTALYGMMRATKPFIDTAAQFEKYGAMLESIEGSSAKAKKSMDWVSNFAAKTPLQLDDVMGSFVKLRTFGMDPMDGTMQSLVDMNARMGGSAENLNGMILQLGQAWTKSKLQGQDIMVLMERGVPVYDLLAKRSGKTTAQIAAMAEAGHLGRGAIKALLEEMGKLSAGASDKQMSTFNGMLSNVGDQWTRFKKMVMDSGPFERIKEILGGVLANLDRMAANGELQAMADKVGSAMLTTLNTMTALYKIGEATWTVFKKIGWAVLLITAPVEALGVAVFAIGYGIGTLISKLMELIDRWTGSGISNWIGRATAIVMSGLGNPDAEAALNSEINNQNPIPYTRPRPLVSQANKATRTEVGGELKITFDGKGMPRVESLEKKGGMDLTVNTGLLQGGM